MCAGHKCPGPFFKQYEVFILIETFGSDQELQTCLQGALKDKLEMLVRDPVGTRVLDVHLSPFQHSMPVDGGTWCTRFLGISGLWEKEGIAAWAKFDDNIFYTGTAKCKSTAAERKLQLRLLTASDLPSYVRDLEAGLCQVPHSGWNEAIGVGV